MNTRERNRERRGAACTRGFTLVELLVAMAIFVTVMGSVALLFSAAIRTSKQGFQNQEAFEVARGVMDVIERDLSRAFTSREHGDVFSFYGTPIGFTFVGLISTDGTGAPNLARVTYVIYHDPFEQLAGAVSRYESVGGEQINTYNLIRYVEPGVDNLDAYPIPWEQDPNLDDGFATTFQSYVNANLLNVNCPDAACEEQAERAFKSEVWIRMLAGGDAELPSAWDRLPEFTEDGLRPEDFTIAENIRFLAADGTPCASTRDDLFDLVDLDFDDRLVRRTRQTPTGPVREVCAQVVSEANDIPIFRPFVNAARPLSDPNLGPIPFFRYWDLGTGQISGEVQPYALEFWNDGRAILRDGLDNDGDCTFDADGNVVNPQACIDEPDEWYSANVGSPLDARLPIAVTVDLTLFFKSPYPGAPDFNKQFTQRIDIPTGYRRVYRTQVNEPVSPTP